MVEVVVRVHGLELFVVEVQVLHASRQEVRAAPYRLGVEVGTCRHNGGGHRGRDGNRGTLDHGGGRRALQLDQAPLLLLLLLVLLLLVVLRGRAGVGAV